VFWIEIPLDRDPFGSHCAWVSSGRVDEPDRASKGCEWQEAKDARLKKRVAMTKRVAMRLS
jgi:hypothetical protein